MNGPSTFCLPTFVHMFPLSLKLTHSECVTSILLFLTGGAGCFTDTSCRANVIRWLLLATSAWFNAGAGKKTSIFTLQLLHHLIILLFKEHKHENRGTKTVNFSVSSLSSSFRTVYTQQKETDEYCWKKGMLSSQML